MMSDLDQWTEQEEPTANAADEEDFTYVQGELPGHWNLKATSTTKIPPQFNGKSSWFAYEEAIDDWCDITELDAHKRGPALRNNLVEYAATYKAYLDRERLIDPEHGVSYFKKTLRQFFVKGTSHVFLWRFMQFFKAHRGQQDCHMWLGRFGVMVTRLTNAWMDCLPEVSNEMMDQDPTFLRMLGQAQANLAAQGAAGDGDPVDEVRREWTRQRHDNHRNRFPLTDNLMALITLVLADLSENQRERLTSTLNLRNRTIDNYQYEEIRQLFMELFCAPRNSWENPTLVVNRGSRSFCVFEEGYLADDFGYWAEDDETGEQGFLLALSNVFWTFDDEAEAWAVRRFQSRTVRRGAPKGKGKRKGRGKRGYRFFRSKGKGKGKKGFLAAHLAQEQYEEYSNWTKGGKKGKGKGKGKSKKGKGKDEVPSGKGYGNWTGDQAANAASDPSASVQSGAPMPDGTLNPHADSSAYRDSAWNDPEWYYQGEDDSTWYQSQYWEPEGSWTNPGDPSYWGFFVQEPGEHISYWGSYAHKGLQKPAVDVTLNPLYVILDVGCTRAMGSRTAINRFMAACQGTHLSCELLPSVGKFSFANSQTTEVTEKCRVWFPTEPPVWTDFDIVEEGKVPMLMSLPQMRNLQFQLSMEPDDAHVKSPLFGNTRIPLEVATTKHLVLDLSILGSMTASGLLQTKTSETGYPSFFLDSHALAAGEKVDVDAPLDPEYRSEIHKSCPACNGSHRAHIEGCPKRGKKGGAREKRPVPEPLYPEEVPEDQRPTRRIREKTTLEPKEAKGEPQQKGAAANAAEPPAAVAGSGSAEQQVPPVPETPDGVYLPPALKRLHRRLRSEVELYKLHVKHYHMSVKQFKTRTSELALPQEILDKYEKVVRTCKICSETVPTPPRSHVSGMRAKNFGDLVFMDFADVDYGETKFIVLIVLDGATNLLAVFPQKEKDDPTTMESLRTWMDSHQCKPKNVVADQAFMGTAFRKFYTHHGINPVPLGPRTPWPNRAESAVRLFKRTFKVLSGTIGEETFTKKASFRQVARVCCWARNVQLTKSGFSPVELAYGRKPPDLLDVENMTPDQLTESPLVEDRQDTELKRLAMQAHLKARQEDDLRKDLGQRVKPSDGPFQAGERVFVHVLDPSRPKRHSGQWHKGRVLGQNGPMVSVELADGHRKVNASMVRRNYDEWHDTPLPETLEVPDDPPAASVAKGDQAQGSSGSSGIDRTANAVLMQKDSAANAAEARDIAFWTNKGGAILEVYDGIPSVSLQCTSMGIDTCEPLRWPSGRVNKDRLKEHLVDKVKQQAPEVLCVTPSSPPHLDAAVWAANHQQLQGKKFLLFIPSNIKECWNHQLIRKLWSSTKTHCVKLAPSDQKQEKTWYLIHNCSTVPWLAFVQKELKHCTLFPERRAKGMNKKVCERVAEAIRADVHSCGSSASLVEDLLSEESVEDLEDYATWLVSRETNMVLAAQTGKHPLSGKRDQIIVDVTDPKIKHYMTYLERMSRGTEIMLHLEAHKYPQLASLATHLRIAVAKDAPFEYCVALRGTRGNQMNLAHIPHDSLIVMWRRRDTRRRIHALSPNHVKSSLDFTSWCALVYWNETKTTLTHDDPVPDEPMEDSPLEPEPPHPDTDMDQYMPPENPESNNFDRSRSPTRIGDPDEPLISSNRPPDQPPDPPARPRHQRSRSRDREVVPELPEHDDMEPSEPRQRSRSRELDQSLKPAKPAKPVTRETDDEEDDPAVPDQHRRSRSPRPDPKRMGRYRGPVASPKSVGSKRGQTKTKDKHKPDEESQDPSASSSSQNPHPVLPVRQPDDHEDSQSSDPEDLPDTEPYDSEQDDTLFVDEADWANLPGEVKAMSQCGSFTTPQVDGKPMVAQDDYQTFFAWTVKGVIKMAGKAAKTGKARAPARNRGRKEATATDLRMFLKQFKEAKGAEIISWKDNEVYDLVDLRKVKCHNWVTGRWVLTVKRHLDGSFHKCKARWVLRGFQDSQKFEQQTDSPTATRPGFRLACQLAANQQWQVRHIDLKTAFLQGEDYDISRDVICQLPPEAGYPSYIGARLKKPAYGMNDAPRRWWNKLDKALTSYGLVPARADRCVYVCYDNTTSAEKSKVSGRYLGRYKGEEKQSRESTDRKRGLIESNGSQSSKRGSEDDSVDSILDHLLDPVTGSPAKGKTVIGVIVLHVDDLFITGNDKFDKTILARLRKDFQVGSEDTENVVFTGQRVRWEKNCIVVDQDKAVEELSCIPVDSSRKDNEVCDPKMHTAYRSLLGQLNWLQSRSQFHASYKFSRAASAAAAPTMGDVRMLNRVTKMVRSNPVRLRFWPLKGKLRILGYPDASYKNNEDQSSQRGQTIFVAEQRRQDQKSSRGSLIDYESTKIRRTTLSTTVSELYSLMKCYGSCQFLKGLWMDISGLACEVHMRTDANNLVTTASTTHLPDQKETIHMIQMLRKEACSGGIDDLGHVRSEDCLADCLTKHSAKPDNLLQAVASGHLPNVDVHPPFRSMLKHKAYLSSWMEETHSVPSECVSMVFLFMGLPLPPVEAVVENEPDSWRIEDDGIVRNHTAWRTSLFALKHDCCPLDLDQFTTQRETRILDSCGEAYTISDEWTNGRTCLQLSHRWKGETKFFFKK